jgi:hypothetical protein
VLAYYGMGDIPALEMPVKRFWLLSSSIDRMKSADDIRSIRVAAAVLDQEAYKSTLESLSESVGSVANKSDEIDREGLDELKAMMS